MSRLFCLVFVPVLLMAGGKKTLDGGTAEPLRRPSRFDAGTSDAGTSVAAPAASHPDAGTSAAPPVSPPLDAGASDAGTADAGCVLKPGETVKSICWPEEFTPMAVLDGAAIVAANAALQKVLGRYPKEYLKSCEYSPRAYDVSVGQEGGWYFVQIDPRMDRCGYDVPPGYSFRTDWFELYAVSLDGGVVERYPHML